MTAAPPRRGLVLGGGGVLGAAWMIGALCAVEEAFDWDVRTAQLLVGTSAGSVLAALVGSGIDVPTLVAHQRGEPLDDRFAYDLDRDSGGALPPRPRLGVGSPRLLRRTLLRPTRFPPLAALSAWAPHGRGSLEPVGRLVELAAPDGAWPENPATWIVAMDYDTGRRVAFGRAGAPPASLAHAVMASCSIPGWYRPMAINGRRYVDGGVCSPTSLDLAAGRDLDEVVVLAPMASFDLDAPESLVGKLERRFRRAVTTRVLREARKVERSGARVTILAPQREDLEAIGVNLMDPRRREAVFETSLRTSRFALAGQAPTRAAG